MREVTFRDLTSLNSRKKDIVLKEVFEKDGVLAKTERRCLYFIRKIDRLDKSKFLVVEKTAGGEEGNTTIIKSNSEKKLTEF